MEIRDVKLTQILDAALGGWLTVIGRWMVIALVVLAFLGAVMATQHFYMVNPDLVDKLPAWGSMFSWPFIAAPLWWKLPFFIMFGLVVLPKLFAPTVTFTD